MDKQSDFYTIPQLAKKMGISRIAVYKKVKAGKIKAFKIGRIYAVSSEEMLDRINASCHLKNK